jgi:hypothetical protein
MYILWIKYWALISKASGTRISYTSGYISEQLQWLYSFVTFQVPLVIVMDSTVFWDVALCNLVHQKILIILLLLTSLIWSTAAHYEYFAQTNRLRGGQSIRINSENIKKFNTDTTF